jgi:RNA polymerase sigma-70 factor (ECF subfamily)
VTDRTEPMSLSTPRTQPMAAADETFSALVREHSSYVFRVLQCLGVRAADVEDLCQETFVVVHRKLPTYEPRGALRSWIYGIALRIVSDYRKRAYRKRELLHEPPEQRSAADQERALERQQDWQLLGRLMAELSEEQRQVFVLFEIEALPMREVIAIVGCPLQTAYSRLQVARKHIAQQHAQLRAEGGVP